MAEQYILTAATLVKYAATLLETMQFVDSKTEGKKRAFWLLAAGINVTLFFAGVIYKAKEQTAE